MNYVKHLNSVFRRFSSDQSLNPTHISLYMALFQLWNMSRFADILYINRQEVMKISKIGSRATYQRCLKYLHQAKYIEYLPSYNPYKSSQIRLFIFGHGTGESSEPGNNRGAETVVSTALVPNINNNKLFKTDLNRPDSKKEVINFFIDQKWCGKEALKFYNHYSGVGWKIGGKIKIMNWKAVAENWILRADEKTRMSQDPTSQSRADFLKTSNSKDYGMPL